MMRLKTYRAAGVAMCTCAVLFAQTASVAEAEAEAPEAVPAPAPAAAPRIGGHLGAATPFLSVSKNTEVVGKDRFFTILTPLGLTLHANDKWALDFELVVTTSVLRKQTTGLIVDPGVLYKALPVTLGLRVAYQVGEQANIGAIPLVNRGFQIAGVKCFVEVAFPTFVKDNTIAFNAVAHTGIAF